VATRANAFQLTAVNNQQYRVPSVKYQGNLAPGFIPAVVGYIEEAIIILNTIYSQ